MAEGLNIMELMQASSNWASRPSDERFDSLDALHAHCVHQHDRSRAAIVSSRQIKARPLASDEVRGLEICGPNGNGYQPSHWAFGQLCARVGAPAEYLRKLPAPLAVDNLNYGLEFSRDIEDIGILIRRPNGEVGEIAAATGPRYGRIWNADITRQLTDRFGDGVSGDWKVPGEFGRDVQVTKDNTTLFASDRDMFVFLADEHNRIEVPNRRDGRSGTLARGFFVWNSEVGAATFGFAQFAFDYVCCNRIVWGATMYKELRIRHTVSAPDRFVEEIEPTLRQISHSSIAPIVDTIAAAQAKKVEDLADFLKSRRFAANMAVKLNNVHQSEEGRPIESLWDVATAMTAHAKSIPFQDERVSLEREAGKVLDLAI